MMNASRIVTDERIGNPGLLRLTTVRAASVLFPRRGCALHGR